MINKIEGRTITRVRDMTEKEKREVGWDEWTWGITVIELDDGTRIYAAKDEELNGPGAFCVFEEEIDS